MADWEDAPGPAPKWEDAPAASTGASVDTTKVMESQSTEPTYDNPMLERQGAIIKQAHRPVEETQKDLLRVLQNKDPNAQFDPNGSLPAIPGVTIGRQIGLKNWDDLETQFKRYYPKGDIISVGGLPFQGSADTWLYREDPGQPYKPLGTAAKVGSLANARNAANILSIGINPEIGMLRMAAGTGMMTAAGDYGDWLINRAQGLSKDIPMSDAMWRGYQSFQTSAIPMYGFALGARGLAPAVSLAAKGVSKVLETIFPDTDNAFTRFVKDVGSNSDDSLGTAGSMFQKFVTSRGDNSLYKLSADAEKEGLPPLTIGQAGNKLTKMMYGQASATTGVAQDTSLMQSRAIIQRLEGLAEKNPAVITPEFLQTLTDKERDTLLAELPIYKMIGKSASGLNVAGGLQAYVQNGRELVRRLGQDVANSAEGGVITLPLDNLKEAAKDIQRGVYAPGAEVGKPVQLAGPTKEIQPFLDKTNALGDNLGNITIKGKTDNAFDQMTELRNGLYDLMSSPDNATRKQARLLWGATVKTFDQAGSKLMPGAIYGSQFAPRLQKFLDTYKALENNIETFGAMANSRDPGGMAAALVKPGNLKTIQAVKSSLVGTDLEPAWNAVVDGFRTNLGSDLGKAEKTITDFQKKDPDVLNEIMPKEEQDAWVRLSQADKTITKSLSGKLAQQDQSAVQNAIQVAQTGSLGEIGKYTAMTGGKAGEYATSVRRGIYQDVLNRATKIDEDTGVATIDPKKLSTAIADYTIGARREALAPVMGDSDWKTLELLRQYAAVAGANVKSVGGSFQAGEIGAQLRDMGTLLTKPQHIVNAVIPKLLGNSITSRVLATPVGQAAFQAANKAKTVGDAMNIMSHAVDFYAQKYLHPARQLPTSIEGEETPH